MSRAWMDPDEDRGTLTTALASSPEAETEAARRWLVMAADHEQTALRQWRTYGIALLRSGTLFSAVRMNSSLVCAAAGTEDLDQVAEHLATALRGPVFLDPYARKYYALVPPTTQERSAWRYRDPRDEVQFLGADSFIGTPEAGTRRQEKPTPGERLRSWWVVPFVRDGDLCSPDAVAQLISVARMRTVRAGEER